ncbi:GNAT family N-acetyltransferase, partial [Klebsiella pneumoniae]|nr:GNAT family N-acetyltransferase [Klebsiella pneumoniae]
NVYTRPEYRNRGFGSQLMEQVIAWAKAQQLEFLMLWPSDRSVPYYQRLGFDSPDEALELILVDES